MLQMRSIVRIYEILRIRPIGITTISTEMKNSENGTGETRGVGETEKNIEWEGGRAGGGEGEKKGERERGI